jgi:hypothetical protein
MNSMTLDGKSSSHRVWMVINRVKVWRSALLGHEPWVFWTYLTVAAVELLLAMSFMSSLANRRTRFALLGLILALVW